MSEQTELFNNSLLEKIAFWQRSLASQDVFDQELIDFNVLIQTALILMEKLERLHTQALEKDKTFFAVLINELIKSKKALEEKKDFLQIARAIVNIFSLDSVFRNPDFF